MSRSALFGFLAVVVAIVVGAYIAMSPGIEPVDSGNGGREPVPTPGGATPPKEVSDPPGERQPPTTAPAQTAGGGNGAPNSPGNAPPTKEPTPNRPSRTTDGGNPVESDEPLPPGPSSDTVVDALLKVTEMTEDDDQRVAILRQIDILSEDMTAARADALLAALSVVKEESSRIAIMSQLASRQSIYSVPSIRQTLRGAAESGADAPYTYKVAHAEASLADQDARSYLQKRYLDEPADEMAGVTIYFKIAPTLITKSDAAADGELIKALQVLQSKVTGSQDVDLWRELSPMVQLSAERRKTFEAALGRR